MKFIKKFESYDEGMSREDMCDMLCSMGYKMNELEVCSDSELADICRSAEEMNMMPMPTISESKKELIKSKPGQGLGKKKLSKRQLQLSKTLKENQDTQNYMFFANIQNIHRMCEEILAMDKNMVDQILSDGHDWANDHISTSKDDVEEVFNFLNTHSHDSEENLIGGPKASHPMPKMDTMDPNFIQTYKDYKGFPDGQ
jgi:hypothetical protein